MIISCNQVVDLLGSVKTDVYPVQGLVEVEQWWVLSGRWLRCNDSADAADQYYTIFVLKYSSGQMGIGGFT